MKKILLLPLCAWLMLCASLGLCTSCDIHMSDNGQLDGFWQLERIDTLDGGGSLDARPQRQFWSVQCDLLQMSDLNYRHDEYIWRFDYTGNTLRLYAPYCVDHAGHDRPVSDTQELEFYGVQNLEETYDIEQLDDRHMTLRSSLLRLRFNRY